MKLIFANRNYSSWSLRPWLVLRHFGIPFDEEQVLLNGEGWQQIIRKKSPSGKVPVLVDGDLVIPETIAIIEYLHDKYPAKGIWPSNRIERAIARAAAAEMHGGFRALRDEAPMNLRASYPGKVDPDLVADDLKRIDRLWGDLLSKSGGPYLFGSFNAADAMFAPVATRIRTYDLSVSDLAQEYVEAIYALPAFQEWFTEAVKEPWIVEHDEIDTILAKRGRGRQRMMHMIKLCVGVATLEELEGYREERAHWWGADYGENVHVHRTRTMPKRRAEIEGQGSIYWVISGVVRCRQPILRLAEAVDGQGLKCCDIIMAPDMVRTIPRPKSPFQGWRYLEPKDAPSDLDKGGFADEGSVELAEELARLGLI